MILAFIGAAFKNNRQPCVFKAGLKSKYFVSINEKCLFESCFSFFNEQKGEVPHKYVESCFVKND
jgi:hypothetical protein